MSKSFKFIHKVSVVFLCFASLLNQILGDKGQDAKSLDIFPLFASPLHSSHEYLLSVYSVPGIVLVVGGKTIIAGKQCRSCF